MEVYLNGELVAESRVKELLEPGFLFGWGLFETLRFYDSRPVLLNEHLKRLEAGAVQLKLDCDCQAIAKICRQVISRNRLKEGYLRISLFKKRTAAGLMVYAAPLAYYPKEAYASGVKLVLYPFQRFSKDPFIKVKAISYLKSRLCWLFAQEKGAEEALFYSEQGFIQEGSRSNVFFVKGGKVFTPSARCGLLEGVTRKAVIDVCRGCGLDLIEGEYTARRLSGADEVFITSSLMEIMPVCEYEGKKFDVQSYRVTPRIYRGYRKYLQKN